MFSDRISNILMAVGNSLWYANKLMRSVHIYGTVEPMLVTSMFHLVCSEFECKQFIKSTTKPNDLPRDETKI